MTDLRQHNNPPDMVEVAEETMAALSEWMKEHPVIQSEEEAREAKVFVDRGRLCVKDIEAERDVKVRPLNNKVKEINEHYKAPRERLQKVINEIEGRFTAFLLEEERKRVEAAAEAARIAEEAERRARDAEAAEQEALRSASDGELGLDVKAVVVQADEAFADYQKASRFAARAEKETKVKIGGGFSRVVSLKTVETLVLVDPHAALRDMGVTDDIREAILKSARAYRRAFEELPAGIEVQVERKI